MQGFLFGVVAFGCLFHFCLALEGPCDNINDYVKTVEAIKSHLGVQFDWPFGLGESDAYKAVVCAATLINVNASGRDEIWVTSVPHLKRLEGGNMAITLQVSDVVKGARLIDVVVDINKHQLHVLAEKEVEGRQNLISTSAGNIDNGSQAIEELLSLCNKVKCERNSLDHCKRGSVEIDPWMKHVLAYQRGLALDRPLNYVQFLGTHNSFNNHADGYGDGDFLLSHILEVISLGQWDFVWAQQWFTMTDQLNMGVRHMMLDPVYFMGEMRLCHAGTTFSVVDKVIKYLDKVLDIKIQFDSEDLGCMPHDRTFSSGLAEICDWVQHSGNENEFVMVYINDEGYSADWNHTDIIWKAVATLCPHVMFTPTDKERLFPHSWPSQRQLVSLGMRLMLTGTNFVQNENIFPQLSTPGWDKDTVKYFTAYPKCGNFTPDQWYLVGGESQVVGPIYNGPAAEGLLTRENIPFILQCDVSVAQMDLVSPALIQSAMWSFNATPPNNSCVAMNESHLGQWVGLPCNSTYNYACVNHTNSMDWVVSKGKGVFGDGSKTCSIEGRAFTGPVDGYENAIVYNMILKQTFTQPVWINATTIYNDRQNAEMYL